MIEKEGKEIVKPQYLKEGDPAYWVPEEVILKAAEVIRSWGLEPVIGAHTTNLILDAYSGTADERAADLLWALEDDTIKAIICTRGGYGSMHLLNQIPMDYYRQHPKWLIGHGDITMLLYAAATTGTLSIHGPMGQYSIPANQHNRCGHAEGILVGGNLSSFAVISGTKFQMPENQDIILFVEEVEESLHAIDRLFYTLLLQNSFHRIKGIILGTFNSIRYDLQYGSVEQMLIAHLHDMDIPVCCGFPVGSNSCFPLIEGAPCSLDVTPEGSLLTFKIEGTQQPYQIEQMATKLVK